MNFLFHPISIRLALLCACLPVPLTAADPVSVAVSDWDGARKSSASSQEFVTMGSHVYFSAEDGAYGRELWRTDGTAAGTSMFANLAPGASSSDPKWFVRVEDKLFFRATGEGIPQQEKLWVTNGTKEGTKPVSGVPLHGTVDGAPDYAVIGGVLYFPARETTGGAKLWRSDGTEAGTWQVKGIMEWITGGSSPSMLTAFNGQLYFRASSPSGLGLWKSDGTTEGTAQLKSGSISGLTSWNGHLYFGTADSQRVTLWRSDGTEAGTSVVKEWTEGLRNFTHGSWAATSTHLYLRISGELWSTDGTEAGTVALKQLRPFVDNYGANMAVAGDMLYFAATLPDSTGNGQPTDYELWKSDGTPEGTVLVKDILPGANPSNPHNFFVLNETLFFWANDGTHGVEWWKSDGTAAGTQMVKDIHPGLGNGPSTAGNRPAVLDGSFIFRARSAYASATWADAGAQAGVWKSDGSAEGTFLLKDTSIPQNAAPIWGAVGDRLAFVKTEAASGTELWTVGPEAGSTARLHDLNPGTRSSSPDRFFEHDGRLYFRASDYLAGQEPWITDGTDAGTYLLKDIRPTSAHADLKFLFAYQSHVYFQANDGMHGSELWKTDGTPQGTALFKDFLPGALGLEIVSPLLYQGKAFFLAPWQLNSRGLWATDGTEAGTVLLKDLGFYSLDDLWVFNEKLLFAAWDETYGIEWWESDGSVAGTKMMADLMPGAEGETGYPSFLPQAAIYMLPAEGQGINNVRLMALKPDGSGVVLATMQATPELHPINGVMCFSGRLDQSSIYELWRTDGTVAGTHVLKTIVQGGAAHSSPGNFFRAGNYLYFTGDDGVAGCELWRTDGTEAGTIRLTTHLPPKMRGVVWREPSYLLAHDGLLYFSSINAENGCELWQTNGTPEGTRMVEDLVPGFGSSFPVGMIEVAGTLYYAVLEDGTGRAAIRRLPPAEPPPFSGGVLTTVTGEEAVLSLAELLAGLPEGVTVQEIAAASAAGGSVAMEAGGLRYTPSAGHQGADSFTVTLSDGQQGTVAVAVHP